MTALSDRISVPETLLRSIDLLPSAKIVWIALMINSNSKKKLFNSKACLAKITGLSRPTVYKALAALKDSGWFPVNTNKLHNNKMQYERFATIYIDLFWNTTLSLRARLFHGLLQATPSFRGGFTCHRYSSLSTELHIGVKTIRKTVQQLARSGWVVIRQINQRAPIAFTFRHPIEERFKTMVLRTRKSLAEATYKGEALMKEFLSLIVDSDNYMDNVKPGFLRNANTDCLMELDRYYPDVAAFEFNGAQHYHPTDLFDAETVKKQQVRDTLKKQLCTDKCIKLVVINPEDLTLSRMLKKLEGLLPLRNLRGGERLINILERFSANYRRNVPGLLNQKKHIV